MISLPQVTLVAIDTTPKVHLAERAIAKSMEQCEFGAVKLLTNDPSRKHAVAIKPIDGLEEYSRFCIQELHNYVDTTHCLVVQSDGYVLRGQAWNPRLLQYDYVGAPWLPSRVVGNGGFSLRSKRLLSILARNPFGDNPHPEDNYICHRHRGELEQKWRLKFPDFMQASRFAFEGRSWTTGKDWVGVPTSWDGQFGFHSWLTPLPNDIDRPTIFHHSGDYGDVIYSLATIKALGGGVLFLSPDNHYPFPRPTRLHPDPTWGANIAPLIEQQDYIWRCQFTFSLPYSTDVDLNNFRNYYRTANPDNWTSLFRLHLKANKADYPEDKAWLMVDKAIEIPGRPIVINRTLRYQNPKFPWIRLIRKYQDKMVFIGSVEEAGTFQQLNKSKIPHIPTHTLLDAARIIAGAKVFVGNQSCPLAIALGLNKPCLTEEWRLNPNTRLKRKNAIFCMDNPVDIPSSWLT